MKTRLMQWTAAAAVLAGCAASQNDGRTLIEQGRWQEGLGRYEQALRERPGEPEPRMQFYRARDEVLARLLGDAAAQAGAGSLDAAAGLYRQALAIDAANARAAAGLGAVEAARRHQTLAEDAMARLAKGDLASAELMARAVLTENPGHLLAREVERSLRDRQRQAALAVPPLKSRLQAPVNLEFRDAPLRQVVEALARSAGINFILDREIRPDLKASIFVHNVRVEDAIDLILVNHQLEKKVLNENTVLVYPNTPAKLREHQELVMRSFQLGNADAKQVLNLLRTMVKTKELYVDERSNILVMRDTPDAVRTAEKLIAAQDGIDAEVMLELEILEVSRAKVRDLGMSYPTQFSGPGGAGSPLTLINNIRSSADITVDSGLSLRLLRTDGETKTLANPRMRIKNREKARVHIGDRVPVISSTIVGTNAAGTAPITTEQIQYIDVGIKIEAEPTIHPDDTVAVKINLDVSSLGTQTRTNAGTTAYEVGTRNATTSLRLKDGETQALMGLIRDDDVQTGAGLPFIGEAPVLDRVFGNKKTERRSRELVLLITPRLVRGIRAPEAAEAEFWSGTEASLRLRSPFVQTLAVATPAAAAAATTLAAATVALPPPAPLALTWTLPPKLVAGVESRIELRAKSEGTLKGASVQLRYDPEQIEVLAVEEGGFFSRGDAKTVFTPRIDAAFGIVSATVGAVDTPASGDAPLFTLRVKPRAGVAKTRLQLASVLGIDSASRRVPSAGGEAVDLVVVAP